MKTLLLIIAFLFRRKVVALQDSDYNISYSLVYNTPFGNMAKRYWPFNIKNVFLNDDGTVLNGLYVKRWKAIN